MLRSDLGISLFIAPSGRGGRLLRFWRRRYLKAISRASVSSLAIHCVVCGVKYRVLLKGKDWREKDDSKKLETNPSTEIDSEIETAAERSANAETTNSRNA